MPNHVGIARFFAWCDRHHPPNPAAGKADIARTGGQGSREFSTATTAGLAEFPRPWLTCRKASPTGGGAVCSVRRYEADQRAAGEIPACLPLAQPFTMGDVRCPLRRPAATGSGNQLRCMQILKMNMDDAETTQKRRTVTEDYEY